MSKHNKQKQKNTEEKDRTYIQQKFKELYRSGQTWPKHKLQRVHNILKKSAKDETKTKTGLVGRFPRQALRLPQLLRLEDPIGRYSNRHKGECP